MQVDVWLSRRMLSEIEYRGSTYHSEDMDSSTRGKMDIQVYTILNHSLALNDT